MSDTAPTADQCFEQTPAERAAVDRIKGAVQGLNARQRAGSTTDIIMDLGDAIAREMRAAVAASTLPTTTVHRFERGGTYAVMAHLPEHSTVVAINDACRNVATIMGVAKHAGASILGTVHVGDRPIEVAATAPVDMTPMLPEQRIRHAAAHRGFTEAAYNGALPGLDVTARNQIAMACTDIATALDCEVCPSPVADASRELLGALAILQASSRLPAPAKEGLAGLVRAAVETATEIGQLTRAAVERASKIPAEVWEKRGMLEHRLTGLTDVTVSYDDAATKGAPS